MSNFVAGNTPAGSDSPTISLQKINSIELNPPIPGFAIGPFDTITLTYFGSTNNPQTVVYSKGGVIQATLTLTYVGGTPSSNDALIATAIKS